MWMMYNKLFYTLLLETMVLVKPRSGEFQNARKWLLILRSLTNHIYGNRTLKGLFYN